VSVIHHPDFRPEPPGPKETVLTLPSGREVVVADPGEYFYERDLERIQSDEGCTFCAKKLTVPAVFWTPVGGEDLYLHPGCAESLARGLLRDVGEIRELYG
jgi:hypothetical protein